MGVKNKPAKARVINREDLYQGRVFGVRREHVIEPNGIEATREFVTHPGSVVVLPVFPDGRILMIRQYRHATGQYLWELVAGRKDEGESFVEGAHRELQEETGYRAHRMTQVLDLFPTPGFLTERMIVFLAEGLSKGSAQPEDDEKITQRIFSLSEIERWIRTGKIRDAKSVAGILFYASFLAARRHQKN